MSALSVEQLPPLDETTLAEYLEQVEFQCSVCDAIHQDIKELNAKIERLYALILKKSKASETPQARIAAWMAGFCVASEIRHAACLKRSLNQICGVDLSLIDEVYTDIKERVEFLSGIEIQTCE